MNRWSALALLLTFAGALALRCARLDVRPFHNDEAINSAKLTTLWEKGEYVYDPHEFHGPTLYFFII
jgi:predicted membrane-bound mannosyltransferase